MVFGSEKASYTVLLNYDQCKFRLYLMGKALEKPKDTLLFPPMIRGQLLHMGLEQYLRGRGRVPFEELWDALTHPVRDDVNFGRRRLVFDTPEDETAFKTALSAEYDRFLDAIPEIEAVFQSYGVVEIRPEAPLERDFGDYCFYGHTDMLGVPATPPTPYILGDLKTGRGDLKSDQFLLYNWLANGYYPHPVPFLVFFWDGVRLITKEVQHHLTSDNPRLQRLLWQMAEVVWELRDAQSRIEKGTPPSLALRPNTRNWTCHPNRCSFWHICPFGRAKEGEG